VLMCKYLLVANTAIYSNIMPHFHHFDKVMYGA
jgi:hypothetical protein